MNEKEPYFKSTRIRTLLTGGVLIAVTFLLDAFGVDIDQQTQNEIAYTISGIVLAIVAARTVRNTA